MKISVIGLGKLGAPLAAVLAHKGHTVIGVDEDPRPVSLLNKGQAPVFEPELERLVQASRGRLSATTEYEKAVLETEISFIVVPTPSVPDGQFSIEFVLQAAKSMGTVLSQKEGFHLVVVTSTVMPGDTEEKILPALEESSGKRCGRDFGLCYNPEFIALGSVIQDFLHPDLLLIGESDQRAGDLLEDLYLKVCENRPRVARMNFVNAEITKLSINTFVTTKISYANMLARFCEKLTGADVDTVTAAMGLDSRIGSKYFKGAIGYGGPCFPRDNLALAAFLDRLGTPPFLAEATDRSNRLQVQYLKELIQSKLVPKGVVGILGLAYKPKTDVVEQSQGLLLAQALVQEKIPVIAYDPAAMAKARKVVDTTIEFAPSLEECIGGSDLLVITTPWEDFGRLEPSSLGRAGNPRIVVDCWRILDASQIEPVAEYIPLGRGPSGVPAKARSL